MSRKHKKESEPTVAAAPEPAGPPPEPPAGSGAALAELPDQAVKRLEDEVSQWKDQYVRLAADLDNFRKRTQRERTEMWARAQADVVSSILDALDDLGRVARLDPGATASRDVLVGVEMVERKLLKELESAGLDRVGRPGDRFDPTAHEAVSTTPAASAEEDHTVAAVFQPGYRFGGALLRPARVQVRIWEDGGPAGEE